MRFLGRIGARAVRFLARPSVLALIIGTLLTLLFRGTADEYERGVLIANIKKKEGWVPPKHVLRGGTLVEPYLFNHYGLRASLAFEKYPEKTVLVYGLFGGVQMFETVLSEWGEHYTIPLLAASYETRGNACSLGDGGQRILRRIEQYFTTLKVDAPEEFEKITRVSCTLIMLYEHGPTFMGPLVVQKDGSIKQLAFIGATGDESRGNARHWMGIERVVLIPQALNPRDIGRAKKEMASIGIGTARAPNPQTTELTFLNVVIHLRRFFERSLGLAPDVFGTGKTSDIPRGFVYLLRHHPTVFSAAIARLTAEEGYGLLVVQSLCWFFFIYPIVRLLYIIRQLTSRFRSSRIVRDEPVLEETGPVGHVVSGNGVATTPDSAPQSAEVQGVLSK